jgi:hypothetical protein
MSRSLELRLERLEAKRKKQLGRGILRPFAMLIEPAEPRRELLPGEWVVIDRFRDAGNLIWVQERITSDLADAGRRCESGGYLIDILAQFHERCHWRKIAGACRMCQGTPVACSNAEASTEEQEVQQ